MASASTIKLSNTMEWAKKMSFNRNFGLGNNLEPALTNANTVLQSIIGPPFAWRWNRVNTGFIAAAGVQDYTLTNWQATTAVSLGWLTVDSNGNSQKVTTAGTTGANLPAFSNSLAGTVADGSAVWTNIGVIPGGGLSTNFSFGWIETVSVQDTTPKWYEIGSRINLGLDSTQARPRWASAQADDGLGNITFRLMPVPDQAYPVRLTIQKKSAIFTSCNQTWSPIPDEFSYLYNWGFLALSWLFSDDPRFAMANQKFVAHLLGASEGLTQTQINIFLNQWQEITGQPMAAAIQQNQGIQARGV